MKTINPQNENKLRATAAVAALTFLFICENASAQCPTGYTVDTSCSAGCVAPNGYCPDPTPPSYERRMNEFSYKASHNSFQREQDMDKQVDNHNVFMIELDLHYSGNSLIVEHHCFDLAGGQTFNQSISELARSESIRHRVTFIYLQQNRGTSEENFCYSSWPSRSDYFADVENTLLSHFNQDQFYTHEAFVNIDNRRWPSMQELVRRGHNLVVAFQERNGSGNAASSSEDFFFGVSTAMPGTELGNLAFTSTSGGCDGGGSPPNAIHDDRWLHRAYPGGSCSGLCSEQNGGYWTDTTNGDYNFIATNCIDDAHTFNYSRVHSPFPTFVVQNTSANNHYGTRGKPYEKGSEFYSGYQDGTHGTHYRFSGGSYDCGNNDKYFAKAARFETRGADDVVLHALD